MPQAKDDYTRVAHPARIEELLDGLMEPGGASLQLVGEGHKPLPVLVTEQRPGEALVLDISAIREVAAELKRGTTFQLLGQTGGKMLRTPALTVNSCQEESERLVCRCNYPHHLEVLQRRASFRARLRLGMEAGGILRNAHGHSAQGDLRDLSLEGCQLELPLAAGGILAASSAAVELELCFSNDSRFTVSATLRHQTVSTERQILQAGFRFEDVTPDKERQLWFLVREIEREAARSTDSNAAARLPSPLFQTAASSAPSIGRRSILPYATPMARRLSRVSGYLDAQQLELQQGGTLDSVQLSRHADRLLLLHDEQREALLFATRCMHQESGLIRHCLSVAAHLLDLAGTNAIPRELRKAIAASAMIHDLGKALLPPEMLTLKRLSDADSARFRQHVPLLLEKTAGCQWLTPGVITAVVEHINERLDGSGYPRHLHGGQLRELARAAAVVDVIDAMRRDRPDRAAWRISDVYRYLLASPERFDQRWVQRYIKHFGLYPIGSLVRFESGRLGWIQSLDRHGHPWQVQLTDTIAPPDDTLGDVIQGDVEQRLGKIAEEIPVST